MITLESFQNEIDVEFHDIMTDLWLINGTSCYTEAAEQAKENIFQRAIKKIKELFQKVKDKITEFLQSKKLKKVEKQLQENPELAKKTVKIPDYDKLHKLNLDTANRMTDKNCDPEKEMAKYKKQRNVILGAGALVTISLGTALVKLKKSKDIAVRHAEIYRATVSEFADKAPRISDMVNDKNDVIKGFRQAVVGNASRTIGVVNEIDSLNDNMSKKLENTVLISKEDVQDFIDNLKKVSEKLLHSNGILLDDYDKLTDQYKKTKDAEDEYSDMYEW